MEEDDQLPSQASADRTDPHRAAHDWQIKALKAEVEVERARAEAERAQAEALKQEFHKNCLDAEVVCTSARLF